MLSLLYVIFGVIIAKIGSLLTEHLAPSCEEDKMTLENLLGISLGQAVGSIVAMLITVLSMEIFGDGFDSNFSGFNVIFIIFPTYAISYFIFMYKSKIVKR